MTPEQIAQAAAALEAAEISRKQIGLLSLAYPGMTLDDAYAVQAGLVARKLAKGRKSIGFKIGLTSKAMQQALNIDIPDSGVLLDDMLLADGATVPAGRFIQPRIEAEIAFKMSRDLRGPDASSADVMAATEWVAPSLEILDTRILRVDPATKKARTIFDTVSDNAANAGLVLGEQRHRPSDHDLRWVAAIVSRNGEVEETGLGAGVLNDPALGIAWLANRLAQYGQFLARGDIVLSGSFIRPIEAVPGSRFVADFGPFGRVSSGFG